MRRRLVSDLVAVALAACMAAAVGGCTSDPPAPANDPSNSSAGNADQSASSSADLPQEQVVFVDVRTGEARGLPAGLTSFSQAYDYRVSPDGSRVVFVASENPGSVPQLFLGSVEGSNVRRLTHGPRPSTRARWSSDGSSIVFVRGGFSSSRLAVIDVETGDVRILQGIAGMISDPSFTPDNRSILFTFTMAVPGSQGSWRAGLWTVPAKGGTPTPLISDGAYGSYSPDGSTIAYHRTFRRLGGGVSSRLSFVDTDRVIDDPESRVGSRAFGVPPRAFSAAGVRWSPGGTKVLQTGMTTSTYGPSEIVVRDLWSRAIRHLGDGIWPTWFDDHTLIVTEFEAADPTTG